MTHDVESYGIHWFRRDLRLRGNPALTANLKAHRGRVITVFCFDPAFISRPDFSSIRFGFFLKTLESLRDDLKKKGGELLFLDEGPEVAFPKVLSLFKKRFLKPPARFTFNRDYEPFARKRDETVTTLLESRGISVSSDRDHLLIEPHEIQKPEGGYYQVFGAFQRKWLFRFSTPDVQNRIRSQADSCPAFKLDLDPSWRKKSDRLFDHYLKKYANPSFKFPPAGHAAARNALHSFGEDAITSYDHDRDIPSIPGTSQLSIYLKNGSLTIAQIMGELALKPGSRFLTELIWREFYYHILFHRPDVETGAFQKKYRVLKWDNSKKYFQAWCEGRTGYPIVDAGMRQLLETGWMHNRVRMIVASFLVKDLLVNWQWGERHFMRQLIDGDLAPNNGGWQWAASTGCDPQPYFRIFNPTLQSKRFDPDGVYIKRFVPELRELSSKEIHEPHRNDKTRAKCPDYPERIVQHSTQSLRALKLFADVPKLSS